MSSLILLWWGDRTSYYFYHMSQRGDKILFGHWPVFAAVRDGPSCLAGHVAIYVHQGGGVTGVGYRLIYY